MNLSNKKEVEDRTLWVTVTAILKRFKKRSLDHGEEKIKKQKIKLQKYDTKHKNQTKGKKSYTRKG